MGEYVDVFVQDPTQLNSMTIKVYYTDADIFGLDESSLAMYYWNTTVSSWLKCSDTGVDTLDDYIWATLTATSVPKLNYLKGGPFTPGTPGIILVPDIGFATTITGGGFAPTTVMKIYWSTTEMVTVPKTVTTDGIGEFEAIVTALYSTYGIYTINATDGISYATDDFTVPDMTGLTGTQGPTGPKGSKGSTGSSGAKGSTGATGAIGPQGETGPQGEPGPEGTAGNATTMALQGEPGPQGETGMQGETGTAGIQGEPGPQGEQGLPGDQGPIGLQGLTGATGPQGAPAPAGVSWLGMGTGVAGLIVALYVFLLKK